MITRASSEPFFPFYFCFFPRPLNSCCYLLLVRLSCRALLRHSRTGARTYAQHKRNRNLGFPFGVTNREHAVSPLYSPAKTVGGLDLLSWSAIRLVRRIELRQVASSVRVVVFLVRTSIQLFVLSSCACGIRPVRSLPQHSRGTT